MKRLLFFLITLSFFCSAIQIYGAEVKKPVPRAKPDQEDRSPETTYHALIIGNNQYKYLPKLKTARNDAVEVEKLLREKFKFQTDLLLDATRANILGKINGMRRRLGEKDNLLIYYAGHGEYDKTVDKSYWLPVDAQRDDPTNWIMADDITSNIKRIAARHVLVVSDSCYSGTLSRQSLTEMITTGEREGYLKKMQERPSRTLMASGGNEPVSDSGGGNNSVFAAAFIKTLKDVTQEVFTAEEVFHSRIKAIVAGKSDQVPEYSSIKNSGDEGGDFVFRLAKIEVEPLKTEADIKVRTTEQEERIRRERQQLAEERAKVEADKKRLEEQIILEKERAKVAEEKVLWEAKKKEAEEQSKKQQETQQKLADEKTRLEMGRKRLEEERKSGEAQKKKLEEEKQQLKVMEKDLAKKKVKKPGLSQPLLELFSILPEYEISQPSPTDPPQVRALLGEWIGKFPSRIGESLLIVTAIDISKKTAQVIYAWPDRGNRIKRGYSVKIAEFIPGEKPIIKWGDGSTAPHHEFILEKDKLEGSRWSGASSILRITMKKIPQIN